MFSLLLHKDIYISQGIQKVCKNLQKNLNNYKLSKHLKEHLESQEDRSHTYLADAVEKCLESLKTTQRECFEVEISKDYFYFDSKGWFVTRYCCRIPYNDEQDLVVAIRPQYYKSKVISSLIVTAWMNAHNDSHTTLDKSKYCSMQKSEKLIDTLANK